VRGLPTFNDPNLIVGTGNFSDAGVYRLREDLWIVQSLDFFPPLVNDPYTYGQIAAANSLSDVYAMGANPTTALNIVGFPDDQLELDILSEILRGGAERTQQAGAVLAGGHTVRDTEIKYGLSVTGVVHPEALRKNDNARPGDVLVLTKALGTGFITTALKAGHCSDEALKMACESMVQLNAAGSEAATEAGANATTDITGFGLAGHAGEMASASGVTLALDLERLPLLTGAMELARRGYQTRASASNRNFAQSSLRIEGKPDPVLEEFAFDAQTSGGLLIAVAVEQAEKLVKHARSAGATATCIIGEVLEQEEVSLILRG
jgi:selenide,water dikinase